MTSNLRHATRRQVLTTLGIAGAAAALRPRWAFGQAAARRPVVGYFQSATRESQSEQVGAFLQGLKDLGYVDGQNVTIEYRFADGFADRRPGMALELVGLRPDVLVVGSGAVPATLQATTTIPVVVPNFGAAQTTVKNLARPEANVTGIIDSGDGGIRQQLELVKELIPGAARIGVPVNASAADAGAASKQSAEAAAAPLGFKLTFASYTSPDDTEAAFRALARERVDAAIGVLTAGLFPKIVALAAVERLPIIYSDRDAVAAGGLMSIAGDRRVGSRRAAYYVDKILKGAKPADLPVEQLNPVLLAVNLATAKALGLTVPASILARADEKIG